MQCVRLRATLGLDAGQIAPALGWQASSVGPVRARYFREGEERLRDQPRGGRYPAPRTGEEEQERRAPLVEKAKQAERVMPHSFLAWGRCG